MTTITLELSINDATRIQYALQLLRKEEKAFGQDADTDTLDLINRIAEVLRPHFLKHPSPQEHQ